MKNGFYAVFSGLFLCSCMMVGPDYKEPKTSVASHWKGEHPSIQETPFKDEYWWTVFNDSVLTSFIQKGYQSNLSLQIAGARVLQARALLAQSVGKLYPQEQAFSANYQYDQTGGSSFKQLLPSQFETASLGFQGSWELDFWGKYRRAIRANDAAFLASLAAYDNTLVTLTADIATAYIKIRTDQALVRVIHNNIQVQRKSLQIANARFEAGESSLQDVEAAKTQLAQTEAIMPSVVSDLQQQKSALAVLLGLLPGDVDGLITKGHSIPRVPEKVSVGIPKEMLARRPDVYQARMEAVSQLESIGAAKANLYPALSIMGSFMFSGNTIGRNPTLNNLFQASNQTILAGPSVSWPLLNYGQITNAVRAQDAVYEQALLNYVNVILVAQKQVQDTMTQFVEMKKTVFFLSKANRSATKTTELSMERYKDGQTDYSSVLNAEQQQLNVQKSLTNAQGDTPLALVAMYRALGGGWQLRKGQDFLTKPVKDEMSQRTNWGDLLEEKQHEAPKSVLQELKQLYLPNW